MKKFEFKYEIVLPNFNIAGSSNDSTGSIMEMLVQKVGWVFTLINIRDSREVFKN